MSLQSGRASARYANGSSSRPTPNRAFTAGQRGLVQNTGERWVTRDDGRKPHEPGRFSSVQQMNQPASQLTRYVAKPATSEGQRLALMARAWIDDGIICLRPEQIANDFLRQAVINAAEKLYGRRQD